MYVEVVWQGEVIGYFHDVYPDQPHLCGRWESAGVPAFEEAFRAAQDALPAGGVIMWEAGFRSPGGASRVSPVRLAIFRDRPTPRFRMGAMPATDVEHGTAADGGR